MAAKPTNPTETRLDDNVTKPATSAPGDGPADTTDPLERATTVTPRPGPEALAAGTVNGVLPLAPIVPKPEPEADEFEEYDAVRPNGETVRVKRSLITGKSEIV